MNKVFFVLSLILIVIITFYFKNSDKLQSIVVNEIDNIKKDNDRIVLDNFIIGEDNFEKSYKNFGFNEFIVENEDSITILFGEGFHSDLGDCKLELIIVKDILYKVRYYPCLLDYDKELLNNTLSDKQLNKLKRERRKCYNNIKNTIEYLNKNYIVLNNNKEWENDFISIKIEYDKKGLVYFNFYDKELYKNYNNNVHINY